MRPFLPIAPVFLRDLVPFETGVLALLEAFQLFLLADRQPELHQHDVVLHQLRFEIVDFAVGAHPVVFCTVTLHALDQHAAIPGSVEQGQPASARQMPPEPPQVGLRLFLVGGCCNRDDLITARVQCAGDATDTAALAGCVIAFEHADHRDFAEVLVTGKQIQAALKFLQLRLIVRLVQAGAKVERFQQMQVVDRSRQRRRRQGLNRRCVLLQPLAQVIQQDAAKSQAAVTLVLALDDVPGRLRGAADAQNFRTGLHELVVMRKMLPIAFGHPPACMRVFL